MMHRRFMVLVLALCLSGCGQPSEPLAPLTSRQVDEQMRSSLKNGREPVDGGWEVPPQLAAVVRSGGSEARLWVMATRTQSCFLLSVTSADTQPRVSGCGARSAEVPCSLSPLLGFFVGAVPERFGKAIQVESSSGSRLAVRAELGYFLLPTERLQSGERLVLRAVASEAASCEVIVPNIG